MGGHGDHHRERNKKGPDNNEDDTEYEVQDLRDRIKSSRGSRFNLLENEFGLVNNTESSLITNLRRKLSRESVINGIRYVSTGPAIHPDNRWYRAWTIFILLWAVYSSFFTPMEFGFFRGLPENLFIMDIVGQVAFLLDIVLQFFVAYRDSQTYRMIFKRSPIALRYLKSHFIIDLLGCLPWDIIFKVCGRREEVRYLLWIRLSRVRKVTSFFQKLEKDIRINYLFTRIVKLIVVELYCTHTAACIFYYLATTLPASHEGYTWIGSLKMGDYNYTNFREIDIWMRYTTSLYFAVVTMATVGYGDIHAVNLREMIFVMIFVSFDMILGAYLIGNMTAITVKGSKTEKFRDKMTDLIKYMNRNRLGKDIRNQIKGHLRLQHESSYTEASALQDLPISIRAKEEVGIGQDGSEETVKLLPPNSSFGEISILCNIPQPYTVRVCELCRLLRIDKQSLSNILEIYFYDGRRILDNLLEGKESNLQYKQLESDITFHIGKQEAELALRVNSTAYHGDLYQLKGLIRAGADPNRTDYDGRSPLHLAASRGYEDTTLFLIQEGVDINIKDKFGNTPLLEAIKNGHDRVASLLSKQGAILNIDDAGSVLCRAVARGDSDFLKRVLSNGIDPNSKDYDHRTPLHVAASEGLYLMAKLLIEAGASVFSKDRWGNTPLVEGRICGNKNLIKLLEEAKSSQKLEFHYASHETTEKMLPKKCTVFPFHPWGAKEQRRPGVVLWIPHTMEELVKAASEKLQLPDGSCILSEDAGKILEVDMIDDGQKLYLTSDQTH